MGLAARLTFRAIIEGWTLLVGIGVLNHEGLHPVQMGHHDSKTDRAVIVLQIEAVSIDLQLLEQRIGRLGQVVESVGVLDGGGMSL